MQTIDADKLHNWLRQLALGEGRDWLQANLGAAFPVVPDETLPTAHPVPCEPPAAEVPESVYRAAENVWNSRGTNLRDATIAAYRETLRLMRERDLPSEKELNVAFLAAPCGMTGGVAAVALLVRDRIVGEEPKRCDRPGA